MSLILVSVQSFALGRSNVGVNFGMAHGGVTLGGEYEYLMKRSYGVAGFARFFQKDDDLPASRPGVFAMGALLRAHQRMDEVNFFVGGGLAVLNIDRGSTDTTSLGPAFSLGLTYSLTDTVQIGLEHVGYWVWLDEDFRGRVVDDTSLRMTFNF